MIERGELQYPPLSARAFDSFCVQTNLYCQRTANATQPSGPEKEWVLYECEKAYDAARWELPDDFLSREAFDVCLRGLDLQSSPGWPYLREAPTIGAWLRFDGLKHDAYQVERLWFDTQLVLEGRFDHVHRAFIKMEPHKREKIDSKRWRIIVASSLPVQMAWRMLFRYSAEQQIEQAYFIPSQQGIMLSGGAWKTFYRQWTARGYDVGLDKSAFDLTCPGWAIFLELELTKRLGSGSRLEEWYELASRMYKDAFVEANILFDNGEVWQQTFCGFMKSGCYKTISINSIVQVMIHLLVCRDLGISIHPLPVCCGDDTLQCLFQAVDRTAYERYGLVVKQAIPGLEFVGHHFTKDGPQPLYLTKHLMSLMHCPDDVVPEYIEAMARMYAHSPLFPVWGELGRRLGVRVRSQSFYLYWYDVESE